MAFACRPALIVLDEPDHRTRRDHSAHDPRDDRALCTRYGVAAVYVSHDVAVVGELASRVAVLYAGRVVEVGRVTDVFGDPSHPYSRGLLRAVPSPAGPSICSAWTAFRHARRSARRMCVCAALPDRRGRLIVVDACPDAGRGSWSSRAVHSSSGSPNPAALRGPSAPSAPATESLPITRRPADGSRACACCFRARCVLRMTQVLHQVDRGAGEQCVAVVGESGSGKTTLARSSSGFTRDGPVDPFRRTPLTSGLRRRSVDDLRRLQYVFQNPYTSLNPSTQRRWPRSAAGRSLHGPGQTSMVEPYGGHRVGLAADGTLLLLPRPLLRGERQRVAIARTIVVGPSLLVCDEVTSALDVSVQASVVECFGGFSGNTHCRCCSSRTTSPWCEASLSMSSW